MLEIISNDSFLANKNLSELPKGISWNPSLFIHDNILLVFRGSNNKNNCLIYKNDSWKEHSTLNENRTHTSVVSTISDGSNYVRCSKFVRSKAKIGCSSSIANR